MQNIGRFLYQHFFILNVLRLSFCRKPAEVRIQAEGAEYRGYRTCQYFA